MSDLNSEGNETKGAEGVIDLLFSFKKREIVEDLFDIEAYAKGKDSY